MGKVLRSDRDWAAIDGELCRVLAFSETGARMENGKIVCTDRSLPYATVEIECRSLPGGAVGHIIHKLDFRNLWAAFRERSLATDEEVLMFWTRSNLRPIAKVFAPFMPKVRVMVWTRGAYERETGPALRREPATEFDLVPIVDWKPGVMN